MKLSQVRLLVDDFGGCFRFLRDDLGLQCMGLDYCGWRIEWCNRQEQRLRQQIEAA